MDLHLSPEERKLLLDLAYAAVKATAEGSPTPQLSLDQLPPSLHQPGATFVTLTCEGVLRGCIGTTNSVQSLVEDTLQRACLAASSDPRFPAIAPEEVPHLEIEVSVLSPPQPLEYATPEQLLERLRPGIDGVILQRGLHRATFLPQVWERVGNPTTFLELLCQKASLHRDAWRSEAVQIEIYQVESFHREPDTGRGNPENVGPG